MQEQERNLLISETEIFSHIFWEMNENVLEIRDF